MLQLALLRKYQQPVVAGVDHIQQLVRIVRCNACRGVQIGLAARICGSELCNEVAVVVDLLHPPILLVKHKVVTVALCNRERSTELPVCTALGAEHLLEIVVVPKYAYTVVVTFHHVYVAAVAIQHNVDRLPKLSGPGTRVAELCYELKLGVHGVRLQRAQGGKHDERGRYGSHPPERVASRMCAAVAVTVTHYRLPHVYEIMRRLLLLRIQRPYASDAAAAGAPAYMIMLASITAMPYASTSCSESACSITASV